MQYFVAGPLLYDVIGKYVGLRAAEWAGYVAAFGIVALIVMSIVWRIVESIALRPSASDQAFSDAPPGLVEYPVEIASWDASGCLGVDRGIVWFEDGLMSFNGGACSFVLSGRDFYRRNERNGRKLHQGLPSDVLRLRVPGRTAYLRIEPLSQSKQLVFGYYLGRFLASVSTSDLPRQWPPLKPYGSDPEVEIPVLSTPEAIGASAAQTGIGFGVVRNGP